MKPSQPSSQAQIPSIQLIKANTSDQTTIRKEQEQLQKSPPPKPTKKRFISKKSMAFMNC
ncbi:hypothetical protein P3T76_011018 [Phytophthora citrophthora]|uniref:Uncharacterized protein n=1 Tax=Phytophthora citrophthora TaxID=4793 RepID=A0AAD9G9U5_9STRA|nr:hypothetical protein P3T76_011018 [Phytophthora citrophthora]